MSPSGARPLGATVEEAGVHFAVRAPDADALWVCLFDGDDEKRIAMVRAEAGVWRADVPGVGAGGRYGYRADGRWAPELGLWFDPDKLLVDPYAQQLDTRFVQDPRLALRRGEGIDTAPLVPKAVVPAPLPPLERAPPRFGRAPLIYEANVRGLTTMHPAVPPAQRGTVAALAHPAVLDHLRRIGVGAIELMPIVAWIDERHLPPLGLRNAWGYNPVVPMALDPGLCPGGLAELRETVTALHQAGIGVILDLVFNHTGESDVAGGTLSFRGLDNRTAYAHHPHDALLVNDTGTGNTLACWQPPIRALILDTLRHFVRTTGIDGFRFDLAPVLARTPDGFDPHAPTFAEIASDPLLADRIMIAEPWDIGPGGYQLGSFPADWLEWNDRYRDDVRRFWRGDGGTLGSLATRIAGSADIFGGTGASRTRSVSFLAAHDGFTLADTVSYVDRHNEANGEGNRDGHGENFSWNNGVEGGSDDPAVRDRRRRDLKALLATLFATRGPIMLAAGDEFGRSQGGNNNAYAQDNPTSWVDWSARDEDLEAFTAALAAFRAANPALGERCFLDEDASLENVEWLALSGEPMTPAAWESAETAGFELRLVQKDGPPLSIRIDREARSVILRAGDQLVETG